MKVYCSCCARQIVSYPASDRHIVGGKPAIHDVGGKFICHECAEDLDEYGRFPEERGDI